jgi:hypothetical protein
MRFMRSLPLNSLRAYFLALRTNIFLKRESVNTKVEDDARARCEEKTRNLSRHVFGMRSALRLQRTMTMRAGEDQARKADCCRPLPRNICVSSVGASRWPVG